MDSVKHLRTRKRITNYNRTSDYLTLRITNANTKHTTAKESKHLRSVEQTIILNNSKCYRGTPPSIFSDRTNEMKLVQGRIDKIREKLSKQAGEDDKKYELRELEEIKKAFVLKTGTGANTKSVNWSVGRAMDTGHIGSQNLGQRGTDANMIVMTRSCNKTYFLKFENRLNEFIEEVKTKAPGTIDSENKWLQVDYYIPEYGTLEFLDKDGNAVELPFAPKFIVQYKLVGVERVEELFHKQLANAMEFTNEHQSKFKYLEDYVAPAPVDLGANTWVSSLPK